MTISARRLVAREELGLSLVAGAENADRTITWAHAIELADPTPYLAGGELVMTTGINIGRTAVEQYDYVARLSAAGTSALAIDTGTTFREVPEGILAAGDTLGMPVVKVPASTPFIAISRAVIDDLTADQLRSVQRVVDGQESMARETLSAGTPGVVRTLAQSVAASVIVTDGDGRLLAAHGPDSGLLVDMGTEIIRRRPSGRRPSSQVVSADGGYCTLQTLKVARALRGYLLVWSREPLTSSDRFLVAHAVSLIAIELEKPAKVIDAEHRLRSAVTRDLLVHPGGSDPGVLRYFGFDPGADVTVGVLAGVGPLMTAEREVREALTGSGPYLMHVADDEVVLVMAADFHDRFRRVHRRLGEAVRQPLRAGYSLTDDLQAAAILLAQARAAARTAPGEISGYGDLGTFGAILGTRSIAELRLIAAPLSLLDTDTGDLSGTLETFLAHNGQIEPAAAALGIHRHTLRNRLQRIAVLTDSDLSAADTRAQLWLALKARQLLSIRGEQPS